MESNYYSRFYLQAKHFNTLLDGGTYCRLLSQYVPPLQVTLHIIEITGHNGATGSYTFVLTCTSPTSLSSSPRTYAANPTSNVDDITTDPECIDSFNGIYCQISPQHLVVQKH